MSENKNWTRFSNEKPEKSSYEIERFSLHCYTAFRKNISFPFTAIQICINCLCTYGQHEAHCLYTRMHSEHSHVRARAYPRMNVQFMVAIIIVRFQLPTQRNECGVNYEHTLDKIEFHFKCYSILRSNKKGLLSILFFTLFRLALNWRWRMHVFDTWCGKENFNFAKKLSNSLQPSPTLRCEQKKSVTKLNRGNIPKLTSTFIRCVTSRQAIVQKCIYEEAAQKNKKWNMV